MSSQSSHPNLPGFTLIEMLVVISIFLIMTGVILANFPAFRDKAALDLLAQEIATTIRQAQVYGIGTREAGSAQQFTSYGIYFDPDVTANVGLDDKTFYLYADKDSTGSFSLTDASPVNCNTQPNPIDCMIEKFAITGAAKIFGLEKCESSGVGGCVLAPITSLDIFFQRFYPEAKFPGITPEPSYVRIMLQSTRDATRQKEIQVWSTGQIVVDDYNPS